MKDVYKTIIWAGLMCLLATIAGLGIMSIASGQYLGSYDTNDTLTLMIALHDSDTGAPTDSAYEPNAVIYKDGSDTEVKTVNLGNTFDSVAGIAANTITLDDTNFPLGSAYQVVYEAEVNSVTGRKVDYFQMAGKVDAVLTDGTTPSTGDEVAQKVWEDANAPIVSNGNVMADANLVHGRSSPVVSTTTSAAASIGDYSIEVSDGTDVQTGDIVYIVAGATEADNFFSTVNYKSGSDLFLVYPLHEDVSSGAAVTVYPGPAAVPSPESIGDVITNPNYEAVVDWNDMPNFGRM